VLSNLLHLLPACCVTSALETGYQPEAGRGALYPNEVASDFAFIPFGGGARKCVGDQFALFEATVALAMLLRRFTFRLAVPAEQVRRLRSGAAWRSYKTVCWTRLHCLVQSV
jgi:hypothetical protein